MPYDRDVIPAGADLRQLVAYIDRELQKLDSELTRLELTYEAFVINGIQSSWYWQDGNVDPLPGRITADSNSMAAITLLRVSYVDAFGANLPRATRSSQIFPGDQMQLTQLSGNNAGFYNVIALPVYLADHVEIQVSWIGGDSGNPQDGDVMGLRWKFGIGQEGQEP